jgi:hypothetical protein
MEVTSVGKEEVAGCYRKLNREASAFVLFPRYFCDAKIDKFFMGGPCNAQAIGEDTILRFSWKT